MSTSTVLSRRHFLRLSALAGGGLLIACGDSLTGGRQPLAQRDIPADAETTALGDFLRISSDNRITVLIGASDVGQGVATGIAMVVAEELDADWALVRAEASPVEATYRNPLSGMQSTVGSTTIRGYYQSQREVGALIRQLLLETAAARWQRSADTLITEASHVIDPASGQRLSYGELATEAAHRALPRQASLKTADQFRLIGSARERLDNADKLNGERIYGMDFRMPGMLTVVLARPPRFGGRAAQFDDSAALQVPGVREVHRTPAGIAVAADDYWSAEQGRKALEVSWNELLGGRTDSMRQRSRYQSLLNVPGLPLRGLPLAAKPFVDDALQADFHFPFQAHAAMEPLNVAVDYDGRRARIWTGTQAPATDKIHAASVLGLLPRQIEFHRLPAGGGFGRRGNFLGDYVRDACQVARVIRKPLKLVWSREDDMRGGFYRPMAAVRMRATLDNQDRTSSWSHRAVVQDLTLIDNFPAPSNAPPPPQDPTDINTSFPYAVGNVSMDIHLDLKPAMPALWMRGVNKVTDIFAQESFLDELAHRAGRDPVEMRREMLTEQPGLLAVLEHAVDLAGWNQPPPLTQAIAGQRAMGLALLTHWDSLIAQVVDLSVSDDKTVTLHRVISAVDCGTVINPDLVKAQIESAVIYALSSLFFGEITLRDGEVTQSNFDDYPVLRMYQTPDIETVLLDSPRSPGGVGELGTPCVGPAVANALLAAGQAPIRELPLNRLGYRLGERHPIGGIA